MIYLLVFVALVMATARLARLIVIDDIAEPIRSYIINTQWIPTKLATCYWCTAVWTAVITVTYTLTAAVLLNHITWTAAAATWPILLPATAYAASRLIDLEGI